MKIKEFIEAAIEGGWKNTFPKIITDDIHSEQFMTIYLQSRYFPIVALDPEAWKAVGKVKGWDGGYDCGSCEYPGAQDDPKYHMSEMVKALCKGKTLEEYIATL